MVLRTSKRTIFFLVILLIIIGGLIFSIKGKKKDDNEVNFIEYTPQEEISNEQLRQTLITLYFINKDTKELTPEARMIDSKKLLKNPYNELIDLLIIGPKNENLEKVIPDGTKINSIETKKGVVYIDFSEEFVKVGQMGAEEENKIINSIVNTLTELTEVNGVKILINGEENKAFEDGALNFNDVFLRINT